MDALLLTKALIAFAPALVLLFVFDKLDVFNLITARVILALLAAGGALAALSFVANWRVMDGFPIGFSAYSRYVAPPIEEALKAAPILAMFVRNRIGFKLDAVIAGFAVGVGFASIENAWYLLALPEANVSDWMVRGFGTAVMHGGATAVFAVISHEMTERQAEASVSAYRFNPLLFAPGLIAAIAIHSAFNHFPHQPILTMAATLLLIPVTLFLALARSERATQQWLRADHAAHMRLLADIRSGAFAASDAGKALQTLSANAPPHAADAIAKYAELKLELVLIAEETLLSAQSGEGDVVIAEGVAEKFARLDELERALGWTAVAAVDARLALSRNDLWELGRVRARAGAAR